MHIVGPEPRHWQTLAVGTASLSSQCQGPLPSHPGHQRAMRPPTSSTPLISATMGAPAPGAALNAPRLLQGSLQRHPRHPRHQRAMRPPTSSAQRTPLISATVGAPAPGAASNAAPTRAVEAPCGWSAL